LNKVSILLAFSAGVLSFLSPCVLPLIPAYVTYLTGIAVENIDDGKSKLNTFYKSIGFVIGFSIIFVIMGASVSSLGKLFVANQNTLRKIGGILVILFGLHTMGIFKIKYFYYEKKLFPFKRLSGPFGPIFMGMAFATGWTPCIGPILSSILIYAGNTATLNQGILLLVIYSLGLAIPFVLTAMAINNCSKYIKKFSKYLPIVSILSGVLMILMGILIFTNNINILNRYFNFINF
jgi:cytochrome c-type biogenesis protein